MAAALWNNMVSVAEASATRLAVGEPSSDVFLFSVAGASGGKADVQQIHKCQKYPEVSH